MDSLENLENDMRQRAATDWRTEFWPAFFLSLITCGIYLFYVIYKLLERREQHFERMISFRAHLIEVLREKAAAAGRTSELEPEIIKLEGLHAEALSRERSGDKSPVLWLVLCIIPALVVYYVYYFLNDDFRDHEAFENSFMVQASSVINKLGLSQEQVAPQLLIPERSFVTYLVLTIVTCSVFGWYWVYTLITDPNKHFDNHAVWEDRLLAMLKL